MIRRVLLLVPLSACTGDAALQRFNSEPEAFIMSHQDGSPVVAATPVEFRGSVSDANHDATDLTVAWTVGGRELCPPGPPSTDGTTLCTASVGADESLLQLSVRDPDDALTSASVTLEVLTGTPPSAEITAPTSSTRLYSNAQVTLLGMATDAEDNPDALAATWEIDGTTLTTTTPASDGVVTGVATLEEGAHNLALIVEDTRGETDRATLSFTVGGPNTSPTCTIDEPLDEASVAEGDPVVFRGTALDSDIASELLQATWSSNRHPDALDTSPPGADGTLVFSTDPDQLSAGVHTITLTVNDEVGASCTSSILLTVSKKPTIEIVSPTSGTVLTSEDSVFFEAQVNDEEDPEDALEVTWTSDLEGLFNTTTPDSDGRTSFSKNDLTPGVHSVTATVTDSDGLQDSRLFNLEITDCGLIYWYRDDDGDGYGETADRHDGCTPPSAYVSDPGDCNDSDEDINPGASELCSTVGVDDDCDGSTDEDDAADANVFYDDGDEDGYGDTTTAATACVQPSGTVTSAGDCDDADSDINPAALEICGNAVDEDCDGVSLTCQVEVSLSDADAVFYGEDTGDHAGIAVAGAGDFDGDGVDDMLIGAPYHDAGGTNAGAAYVVQGPVTGAHSLADADSTFLGTQTDDRAGRAVAGIGDLDNDGVDEILIGAATECSSSSTGTSVTGTAYLLYGPSTGTSLLSYADVEISGTNTGDKTGFAVAGAGDVNNDGVPDLLVGSCGEDSGGSNAGMAYLLLGPVTADLDLNSADTAFTGERSSDLAASALAGAGDANGDGYDDLLIGAYADDSGGNASGSAYLMYGPATADTDLAYADAQLIGESAQDFAGRAVDGAGDTNNDGYDDLLIGASGSDLNGTASGAAYVVLGSASSLTGSLDLSTAHAVLVGETTLSYAGRAVSGWGDIDSDGNADFLVGAHGTDDGSSTAVGAGYIAYGPVTGSVVLDEPEYKLTGQATGDEAGYAIAHAGDIDSDGLPDVVVGAWQEQTAGVDAGAAYLVLGNSLP